MKFLKLLLASVLFASASTQVFATEGQMIPVQCQKLFDEAESLVSAAEKQPGTHPNLTQIREKLNASKAKILQLEYDMQIKSCGFGLAKLNRDSQNDVLTN